MATMQKLERRKNALMRLEKQLQSGVKPEKIYDKSKKRFVTTSNLIPLNELDISRIQKEIINLKK